METQGGFAARLLPLQWVCRVPAAEESPKHWETKYNPQSWNSPEQQEREGDIHDDSPWSLGLVSGSVLPLPIKVAEVEGPAPQERTKQLRSHLRFVISHGSA